jgi:hypothetical protein
MLIFRLGRAEVYAEIYMLEPMATVHIRPTCWILHSLKPHSAGWQVLS